MSSVAAAKFKTSIKEGLTGRDFRVASRKKLQKKISKSGYFEDCYFGKCLNEVFKSTGIRLVLVARMNVIGPSYSFVISLLDTRTGLPTSQVSNRCDVCTLDEAIAHATLAVVELVSESSSATDPSVGPTGSAEPMTPRQRLVQLNDRMKSQRSSGRKHRLWLSMSGAVLTGLGIYLVATTDHNKTGYAALGAGASFGVAGATMWIYSSKF